ncbi:MAG: fatty oxidation complex subunit alpha, partial [Gemmatimonadetes bacterium]|nr:fatty oxidation complex subunit alpha [Gemmatimonadota bacterium]
MQQSSTPYLELSSSGGLAHVIFDDPARGLNVLSRNVMEALSAVLEELEKEAGAGRINAVLFRSGKEEGFIAGADVGEFALVSRPQEAEAAARQGQDLFNRIAALPVYTLAAIHGVCLGGGTELSLACDGRVASDHESTRIGLPEVQLGILPAWGGTTRLPRLVGLQAALDLLLTGRPASVPKARRMGLVDRVLPHAQFEARSAELAIEAGQGSSLDPGRGGGGLATRLLDGTPPGRALVLRMAKRRVMKETGGHYPAPLKVLEVVRKGLAASIAESLELEAAALGSLLTGTVSRNLQHIFHLRERARKGPWATGGRSGQVSSIGVVGAGVMGGGIAQLAAYGGIPVRMKDIRHEAVLSGLSHARSLFDQAVKRRKLGRREASQRMDLVSGGLTYGGFLQADLVVEAVVERMNVKKAVLAELESHVGDGAVITSNTSSLSIDEMAEAMARPQQFAGMHFFNPVHKMPLVEVVRGQHTHADTVETVAAFSASLGKVPVVTGDGPGFLVNRILGPYLNEAGHMLDEGYDGRAIDGIWKSWGMPMGPYRLIDEVGIDVMHHAGASLHEALGDRLRPSPALVALAESGRLGKKDGRGFYQYEKGRSTGWDATVYEAMGLAASRTPPDADMVADRLSMTMIN